MSLSTYILVKEILKKHAIFYFCVLLFAINVVAVEKNTFLELHFSGDTSRIASMLTTTTPVLDDFSRISAELYPENSRDSLSLSYPCSRNVTI